MDQFIEAVKVNLTISNMTQPIDMSEDKFPEEIKKLRSLILNIDVPIYYLNGLSQLESIYIINYLNICNDNFIDYADLNKYLNLKNLVITSNDGIEKLDVSNLVKLQNLIIIGNPNLTEIHGIEKLQNLDKVIIVGNNIKIFDNYATFLNNTKKASICKLDVNMYHYFASQGFDVSGYNVSFAEKISVGELYNLDLNMMDELYTKAIKIIYENIKPEMSDYDKIKALYQYIVQNLTYDYESLKQRDDFVFSNDLSVYSNEYKDINTSYKALKDKKVVCEGYANLLKFLLNIIGIEAENIVCFKENENKKFEYFNHTASRIKLDGNWYYCDSQLETDINNLRYFMKPIDEFEKTHRLPDKYKQNRSSK